LCGHISLPEKVSISLRGTQDINRKGRKESKEKPFLLNEHAVAVRIKAVMLVYGVAVCLQEFIFAGEGRYQH
jgi:hypothetical protein